MVEGDEPALEQMRDMVERARALAAAGDHAALTALATVIWRRSHEPLLSLTVDLYTVLIDMDSVYEAAFPVPADNGRADLDGRLGRVADVLDCPWPTPGRANRLAAIVAEAGAGASLNELARQAISATPSAARTRVLRLLACSRLSQPSRRTVAEILEALYEAGALDLETVEAAFTAQGVPSETDRLGGVLFGPDAQVGQRAASGFLAELRSQFDEVVWRLTSAPNSDDWFAIPESPAPRGLRFVLRGLDVWAGRLPSAPGLIDDAYYRRKLIRHLCAAELTGDELRELADVLGGRPEAERKVALAGQPSLAADPDVRSKPSRLAPTADDPVGEALAEAGEVVSRFPFEDVALGDLREFLIKVRETDPAKSNGFNTALWFDDGCAMYADLGDDGLEQALADQPGIDEVYHMDREVVYVRSSLALADLHAAAIRALLDINRQPRPAPDRGLVSEERLTELAAGIAGLLAQHGFSDRHPMTSDGYEPPSVPAFHRICQERLLQVIRLSAGFGGLGDGTKLEGTVELHVTLFDFPIVDPTPLTASVGGQGLPRGTAVASWGKYGIPPNGEALGRILVDECLPWLDRVNSREVIARGWVLDPNSQPPYPLWEKLEVAAGWGMRDEAVALLRYGNRMEMQHGPKFAVVAEKYQL
jgi:hypothetical protein